MGHYEEAAAALRAVSEMWQAVREDDDDWIRAVVLTVSLAQVAQMDPRPAGRWRDALGVSTEDAPSVATSFKVRRLRDGSYVVKSLIATGPGIQQTGDVAHERRGWAIRVVNVDGAWLVSGPVPDQQVMDTTVEYIDVIPDTLSGESQPT